MALKIVAIAVGLLVLTMGAGIMAINSDVEEDDLTRAQHASFLGFLLAVAGAILIYASLYW